MFARGCSPIGACCGLVGSLTATVGAYVCSGHGAASVGAFPTVPVEAYFAPRMPGYTCGSWASWDALAFLGWPLLI